uniref:Uncharacterized protein n=2 Tax=Aotus nancymaae TaxID=37293 RepID=A0A2K5DVI8_AOTNA
ACSSGTPGRGRRQAGRAGGEEHSRCYEVCASWKELYTHLLNAWMFFPLEKPDVKQKSTKRKFVIPQIIITRASNESLVSYGSSGSEEQRTIREPEDWGPYQRHRTPSTADAYDLHTKE